MHFYHPNSYDYQWTGRATDYPYELFWQMVHTLDLNTLHSPSIKPAYALLGFACDTGIKRNLGRIGAAQGPNAIREALAKLAPPQPLHIFDAGNLLNIQDALEDAQDELATCVYTLLNQHFFPIILGGGHETAWGHFLGLHRFYQDKNIAILNFDAHFDLRPFTAPHQPNSGTPFRQIQAYKAAHQQPFDYYCAGIGPYANTRSLFEFADSHQVHYLSTMDILKNPQDLSFIDTILERHDYIYTTLCLDVFASHIAPGVSAPQVMGIEPEFVFNALKKLKQSRKVISLDIVELSPPFDQDQRTAKLAAHLLLHFMSTT